VRPVDVNAEAGEGTGQLVAAATHESGSFANNDCIARHDLARRFVGRRSIHGDVPCCNGFAGPLPAGKQLPAHEFLVKTAADRSDASHTTDTPGGLDGKVPRMLMPLKDENPTYRKGYVTWALIALNVFVFFFIQGTADPGEQEVAFTLEYAAIPCEISEGRPLTTDEINATFTSGGIDNACNINGDLPDTDQAFPNKFVWSSVIFSMFLHAGFTHLGGNMLYLWIFGNNIEDRLGTIKYLVFYVLGGIAATAAHIFADPDSSIPVVGASGAIAAVMGAYLVWYPQAPIRTWILLMLRDISAKWALGIWFITQFFTGSGSSVAWLAHVGGFIFGAGVALTIRASKPLWKIVFTPPYRDIDHWDNTGGIGRGPLRDNPLPIIGRDRISR